MTRRRITSFDVAEAAGVSRTTVSFVLNDVQNQTIPDKTRAAVLDAAKRLGYTPSAAAKALRAGRSHLVLVLGPTAQPSELMDAGMSELTHRLRAAGYATVVAMSSGDAESLDVLWQSVSPAAVVSMYDMPISVRSTVEAMNIPVIDALFHTASSMPGQFELQVDVGRQQAQHVIERGATRLVFAHPPREGPDVSILDDRGRGVREVAGAHDIPVDDLEVPWKAGSTSRLSEVFHRGSPAPAICAYNDLTALRVMSAARQLGFVAPADYLIIGVDDVDAAPYATPSLSSVRFEIVEHISAIAAQVVGALSGAPNASQASSPGPLSRVVARESA